MTRDPTDEQLLAEFTGGRASALGDLAGRYERALLGLASGLLRGRRDLAGDAVQETWVRVIRFAKQFAGRSRFKTWIYRILVNQCHSLLSTLPTNADGPPATTIAQPQSDRESGLAPELAERDQAVRAAVQRLSRDQQVVVLLCYHSGMTHEQAAEILEIPVGTLKSRLHAALGELRTLLAPEAQP